MGRLFNTEGSWFKRVPPLVFALVFLEKFMGRIQSIICSDKELKKLGRKVDLSTKTVATSLAVWISQQFGVSSAVAIALTVSLLLLMMEIARDTFCDEDVLKLIRKLDDSDQSSQA